MKINKIVMTGFGPYVNRTEIDMDLLGPNGIFLISGDTGCGKTMIFDAITYALYGKSSGGKRSEDMLRSNNLPDKTMPTEVEMTFTVKNARYHIKRNPKYEKRNKKGGFTTVNSKAELTLPDGTSLTKTGDIKNKIMEVVQLDKEQFSQIAMIAQGNFYEVLYADTKKRQEIFREIFKTENFEKFKDRLKDDCKKNSDELKEKTAIITAGIQNIRCDENSVYFEKIEQAKNNEVTDREIADTLELLIQEDKVKSEEMKETVSDLEKKIGETNEQIKKADAYQRLEETRNTISEKKKQLESRGALLDKANKAKEQIPKITVHINDLTELKREYNKFFAAKKAVDDLKKQGAELGKNIETAENGKNNLTARYEQIKNCEVEYAMQSNSLNNIRSLLTSLEKIQEDCKDYGILENKLAVLKQDYNDAKIKYNEASERYNRVNKAFLDGQAGMLAKGLKENEPCPVCGSCDHPNKAVSLDEVPDKEDVKRAKEEFDRCNRNINEESLEISSTTAKKDEKGKSIILATAEFYKGNSVNEVADAVSLLLEKRRKERDGLQDEVRALKEQVEEKNRLEKALGEFDDAINKGKDELLTVQKEISKETATEELLKKSIDGKKSKYKDFDGADIDNTIAELQRETKKIKAEHENCEREFDECNQEVTLLLGTEQELSKTVGKENGFDLPQLQEEYRALENEKNRLEDEIIDCSAKITVNTTTLSGLKKGMEEIVLLEEKYGWLNELYQTAGGSLSAKEKVSLETYVQKMYFDRIIAKANTRFLSMSGGQYELTRQIEAENLQKSSGLDLDVIDHYSGKTRSVNTLSGGEAFMASLSLALGLADEIQQRAGGIQLDTMFIDEGFGTLSDDVLQQAMNVLNELSSGNRLIGVISHLSNVKENIDKQICVTKDKTGCSSVVVKV